MLVCSRDYRGRNKDTQERSNGTGPRRHPEGSGFYSGREGRPRDRRVPSRARTPSIYVTLPRLPVENRLRLVRERGGKILKESTPIIQGWGDGGLGKGSSLRY